MLITEIAEKAQVSAATVSRAINQPELVSPESLRRIQAVMRANNYQPKPLSRRRGPKVRKAETYRVGVWFVGARAQDPNLNWFQDVFLEVQDSGPARRVDLRVLFSRSANDLPDGLEDEGLDGLILQGMEPSQACLDELVTLPNVWFMTRRSTTYQGDYVEPNNEENGRMAAEYLKKAGHKAVAAVAADPDYSANVRRVDAFLDQAQTLGLAATKILGKPNPAGVSFLQVAPFNEENASLARRVLAASPRPTGLYLPVDHFCGAFFRAMRACGQEPGRDFEAILGNYNPVIFHNLDHTPVAIDINLRTLVRKVVDHLLWRIENLSVEGRVGLTVSPTLLLPDGLERVTG